MKKVRTITIIGYKWFDKVNGNTYFAGHGLVNGEVVVAAPFQYGYGNQFEYEIFEEIKKTGMLGSIKKALADTSPPWTYCKKRGISYYANNPPYVHYKRYLKQGVNR